MILSSTSLYTVAYDHLANTVLKNIESCSTPDCSQNALLASFEQIESSLVQAILPAYQLGFGEVASVGSCVTLAVIQREKNDLFVANLGDCRVVLAQQSSPALFSFAQPSSSSSSLKAVMLTRDHNAREPAEQLALRKLHPQEDNIVVCKSSTACYVKGRLQLTRALGDAYLKYSAFNNPLLPHRSRYLHLLFPY